MKEESDLIQGLARAHGERFVFDQFLNVIKNADADAKYWFLICLFVYCYN
jgi:hypothetical protein